ncbi:MAG: DUF523 domain-containing protein [Clostridia bacterium]|nr:DUF523 domain-containing protein [Clostridia bacterium]
MESILISACLLGLPCRYDGASKPCEKAIALLQNPSLLLIPYCPECCGGLPTPRPPAERQGERVINAEGQDVTAQYQRGAEGALQLCRLYGCKRAILKAKSPSCGSGQIYDGRFAKALTQGDGVTAALLKASGITVETENDL